MLTIEIPARRGKAARLRKGQTSRSSTPRSAGGRHLGVQSPRTCANSCRWSIPRRDRPDHPVLGERCVSNRRRPILTVVEDTSGGIHDTLIAACDRYRYEWLGCAGYHDNCTDNLAAALAEWGWRRRRCRPAEPVHEHPV